MKTPGLHRSAHGCSRSTACGTLQTSLCVGFRRASCCGDRVRRCPVASPTVAAFASLRLPCAARLEGAPHNSLRSLRSLRSDRMRQVSPRSSLRSPPSRLRCSAPHTAPPPGTACRSGTGVAFGGTPPLLPAKGRSGGARRAWEAPRSAGLLAARTQCAHRQLTRGRLFERSERSERSEFDRGPEARAPQGRWRYAPPAEVAPSPQGPHAFAAPLTAKTNGRGSTLSAPAARTPRRSGCRGRRPAALLPGARSRGAAAGRAAAGRPSPPATRRW